jgi:predicted SAM-dependent methyltransferase
VTAISSDTRTALLAVLVLSDGQPDEALVSAASAVLIAEVVVVLERGAAPDPGLARVDWRQVDWAEGDEAAHVVGALAARWVLVLGAGEELVLDDPVAVRDALAELPPGPVEVAGLEGAEVRVHPATADAVEAIGGRSDRALPGVRVVPAGWAPPSPAADQGESEVELERMRERGEAAEERRLLALARGDRDVCWLEADHDDEPLVTVRIATYDRGQMIVDRAIASALAQTYERLEILVVGDACDAATERAVRSVRDPRVRFVNLPRRGTYPDDRMHRWMVAGSLPMNTALVLAQGAWLAPCDDDDELTADHVEVLLGEAKRRRLEMVWSKARCEVQPGQWDVLGSEPLEHGRVSHGSVMYSLGLRFFQHSNTAWKLEEPGDWNLWRRMRDAGVRMGFVDHVSYVHYLEGYKRAGNEQADAVAAPPVRLHLGCGPNRLDGWINVDIEPAYEPDVVHDLSEGLPAERGSVDLVYSEHFFEHIPLDAGRRLLAHCFRALRPGGRVRIAMPDLAAVVEAYRGDWRDQEWLKDPAYSSIDTACHMLNFGLREWGHQYVYDADDLRLRLEQAGFVDIVRCPWNESAHPDLRGLETRPDSRLIMEAVKPL